MRRTLVFGLAALLTLFFCLLLWSYRIATLPLPKLDGRHQVTGLSASVEILRDDRGIPHVFASNKEDLLIGQGYAHAQDRWFTMEFYRRIARGELAALVGGDPEVNENDRLMRTLGFVELAERDYAALDKETQAAIDAFATGINAYISDRKPEQLAVEYSVLKLGGLDAEVRPWTAIDSLAVGKLMGFASSGKDATMELDRAAMRSAVSPAMYAQWRPDYDFARHPTAISADDLGVSALSPPTEIQSITEEQPATEQPETSLDLKRSFALLDRIGFGTEGAGSNSWVVSGELTKSGLPMLAVDPHSGIELPNLWHEIGLYIRNADDPGGNISVYGFAAAPFFLILDGRNDFGAWGTTNVTGGDTLDLFKLALNPENPQQYWWDGEWRELVQQKTQIDVNGADPVSHIIERAHFGPVLPAGDDADRFVVRWGGFERSALARASVNLPFNKSYEDLRASLSDWDYPPTHFLYAGIDGDIGIQQAGRFPIRATGANAQLPQDGSTSRTAWRGYIPYDLMPHAKNSVNGYFVSSNNPAAPPAYFEAIKRKLGGDGEVNFLLDAARGYRGARVSDRVSSEAPHDMESFVSIQMDTYVDGLRNSLQPVFDATRQSPSACRSTLEAWRGDFTVDSAGVLVFAHFWTEVLDSVYAPHFPVGLMPKVGMTELLSLETILADADSGWWDDPRTNEPESRDDRLPALLDAACEGVEAAHGENP
ncbi:MAG: penicillin acylase family protein, partial [Pseudomonadota bacterium]